MKNTLKYFLLLTLGFIALSSCQQDDFSETKQGVHFSPQNKKFTFSDFKRETGIEDFKFYDKDRKANIGISPNARLMDSGFVIDTLVVIKHIDENQKVTYTFKAYPINEELGSKEYYNLVYEKQNGEWNEIIFKNKETELSTKENPELESSVMVYNARFGQSGGGGSFTEVTTFNFHCTQTGDCASGACDMCNLCVSTTISYTYNPIMTISDMPATNTPITGGGGGGTYSGVYVPNPYDGQDLDLNNPQSLIPVQTGLFLNSLPSELSSHATGFIYSMIVNYFFNATGVNDRSKARVTTALTNYNNFVNGLYSPNWMYTTTNRLKFWGFTQFLNNQSLSNTETVFEIKDYFVNTSDYNFVNWSADYLYDNQNVTPQQFQNWFMGEVDFVEPDLSINPENISYETSLTQQPLPTFNNFVSNFPKLGNNGNYSEMPASQVYQLAGGSLLNSYNNDTNGNYSNACSIRGSRALLYSGITIPVLNYGNGQRTQKGGDNLNYILDAVSFNKFMIDKFGDTPHKLEGTNANDSQQVANLLNDKNGIYVIINSSPGQAGYSGHVDAIVGGICIGSAYTLPQGGVKSIRIWVLD